MADTRLTGMEACPFCDADETQRSSFGFVHDERGCWVACMKCHAEGPLVEPADNDAAIAAWNRRTLRSVEPPREMVELAESVIFKFRDNGGLTGIHHADNHAILASAFAALRQSALEEGAEISRAVERPTPPVKGR